MIFFVWNDSGCSDYIALDIVIAMAGFVIQDKKGLYLSWKMIQELGYENILPLLDAGDQKALQEVFLELGLTWITSWEGSSLPDGMTLDGQPWKGRIEG